MTRRVKKAFKNDENAKVWFSPLLINSLHAGYFFFMFLLSADFFQN